MEIPDEVYQLAERHGLNRAEVETAMKLIDDTPFLAIGHLSFDGQDAGTGTIRVAREYDANLTAVGEPELSLILLDAGDINHKIAFTVNRAELLRQLR